MTAQGDAADLISVITPCYNGERYIARAVQCVLGQRGVELEHIVVDDGSTDASLAVLKGIADPRLRVTSQPNRGVSAARNRGIEAARGTWIAFLDADDTWDMDILAKLGGALRDRPDAVLAYCGWQNVGLPGGQGEPHVPPDHEGPDKAMDLLASCRWPIHATLTRAEAIRAAGGFNPAYRNSEDFALWLRVAIDRPIVRVPEVLAYYHFHGGAQASGNRLNAALQHWQAQRDFLAERPDIAGRLGRRGVRRATHGELLHEGMVAYWQRDLATARAIFRRVMRQGYGAPPDWRYMLPALLPLPLHRTLLGLPASQP
jgi:hypothetical protein